MARLEAVLWKLYIQRDPRISVLESFQEGFYTYVKMVVNDGKHDIIVQQITDNDSTLFDHEYSRLNECITIALKKAADIIAEQALEPMITGFL